MRSKRKALLEGVSVDRHFREFPQDTPLHLAAMYGHAEVVELLLSCGRVMANKVDNRGYTPLHNAVRKGHVAVVE